MRKPEKEPKTEKAGEPVPSGRNGKEGDSGEKKPGRGRKPRAKKQQGETGAAVETGEVREAGTVTESETASEKAGETVMEPETVTEAGNETPAEQETAPGTAEMSAAETGPGNDTVGESAAEDENAREEPGPAPGSTDEDMSAPVSATAASAQIVESPLKLMKQEFQRRSQVIRNEMLNIQNSFVTIGFQLHWMRAGGIGCPKIARELNEKGILPPRTYYFDVRGQTNPYERTNKKWNDCTVRHILENEAYLGHTVQHKEECVSYKDRRMRAVSPDEWIRVEDTHEPIITKEQWEECRRVDRLRSRPRQSKMKEVSLFSGLLFCADCGYSMRCQVTVRRKKNGVKANYEAYMCGSYSRSGHTACTTHYIPRQVLEELVLSDIQDKAGKVCVREKEVIRRITEQRQTQGRQEAAAVEKSAKALKKRLSELDRLIRSTYEDKVLGKIPEALCVRLMTGYQSEQEEKAAQLEEMEEKLTEYRKVKEDVQEWAGLIRQYRDADILDRDMLLKLIDRIEVGEACVVNGQKERQIRICYKFAGDIG